MLGLDGIAKLLLLMGGAIVLSGVVLWLLSHLPYLGKLPGDIFISRGSFSIFIPTLTMVLLSVVLTVVLNLLARILR